MTKFSQPFLWATLAISLVTSFSVYIVGLSNGGIVIYSHDFSWSLSLVSLFIFLCILICGLRNASFFFLLLPICVLAVPNAVNDLFPSFLGGPISDRGSTALPLFTHIDLYALVGLFKLYAYQAPQRLRIPALPSLSIFVISLVVPLGYVMYLSDYNIPAITYFGNNFQIRYMVYVLLLLPFFVPSALKGFQVGVCVAGLIVLLESILYTIFQGSLELMSGNFGINTLAVLFGVVLIQVFSFDNSSRSKCFLAITFFCAIALTKTVSVVLALTLLLFFVAKDKWGRNIYLLTLGTACAVFFVVRMNFSSSFASFLTLVEPFSLLTNYDYYFLLDRDLVGGPLTSLLTRWSLVLTSIQIILEYPFGIGFGSFNFHKSVFGFAVPVFIDPHNDFLNFLVQFGLVSGLLMILLIFLIPLYYSNRVDNMRKPLFYTLVFVAVCGLSNCNLNKHQFFFFVLFLVFAFYPTMNVRLLQEGKSVS